MGAPTPGRTFRAIANAFHDVGDLLDAFQDQVVAPACALAGAPVPVRAHRPDLEATFHPRDDGRRMDVAHDLLFAGRSVTRILERSRAWHLGAGTRQAGMPLGGGHAHWPAGLPDATVGDVEVRVLVTAAALTEEGLRGPDARGVMGLHHCVGGYAHPCVAGQVRILSLRGRDRDGREVRLSTAEVAWDEGPGPYALQHRGARNEDPPPQAGRALSEYLRKVGTGELPVDRAGLAPLEVADDMVARAGYDWRRPGHWERVRDLWDPVVPRSLRGRSFGGYARTSARSGVRGSFWMPDRSHLSAPASGCADEAAVARRT